MWRENSRLPRSSRLIIHMHAGQQLEHYPTNDPILQDFCKNFGALLFGTSIGLMYASRPPIPFPLLRYQAACMDGY